MIKPSCEEGNMQADRFPRVKEEKSKENKILWMKIR